MVTPLFDSQPSSVVNILTGQLNSISEISSIDVMPSPEIPAIRLPDFNSYCLSCEHDNKKLIMNTITRGPEFLNCFISIYYYKTRAYLLLITVSGLPADLNSIASSGAFELLKSLVTTISELPLAKTGILLSLITFSLFHVSSQR